jgi:hypothetical protein
MKVRPALTAALLALLVLCVQGERAEGTKIDDRPRPAVLVGKAGLVVALKAEDCLAAYTLKGGTPLQEFQAGGPVQEFDVSADGRFLACSGSGYVAVWDLQAGRRLWQLGPARTGLKFAYDLSFARDGRSFVVTDYAGIVAVYETGTGREVRAFRLDLPMPAALSPDGSRGVLVDHGRRLNTFEVAGGALKATEVRASWPARYSADGKYIACRSEKSGVLRVVEVGDPPSWKDIEGLYPRHVRPAEDGTFLVSGTWWTGEWFGPRHELRGAPVGVRLDPATAKSEEVWNARNGEASRATHDFDPGLMLGVVTRFDLVTTLYDLRTGGVRLTIDNRRNYRPSILSTNSRSRSALARGRPGPGSPLLPVLSWASVSAVVVLALALCWRLVLAALRRQ